MAASAMTARTRADEAMRLAGDKFRRDDPVGAKILAAKAQTLCPSLPGLAPTLAAYRVHAAAATRRLPTGDVDWYAVLDVRPADGLDAAKKQFKRLCLLTHPDKNGSAAAEGAFRLVMKAWDAVQSWSAGVGGDTAQPRTPPNHQSCGGGDTAKPSTPPNHQSCGGGDTAKPRRTACRRSSTRCSYRVWDMVCPFCGSAEARCCVEEVGIGQWRERTLCCRCKKMFTPSS